MIYNALKKIKQHSLRLRINTLEPWLGQQRQIWFFGLKYISTQLSTKFQRCVWNVSHDVVLKFFHVDSWNKTSRKVTLL